MIYAFPGHFWCQASVPAELLHLWIALLSSMPSLPIPCCYREGRDPLLDIPHKTPLVRSFCVHSRILLKVRNNRVTLCYRVTDQRFTNLLPLNPLPKSALTDFIHHQFQSRFFVTRNSHRNFGWFKQERNLIEDWRTRLEVCVSRNDMQNHAVELIQWRSVTVPAGQWIAWQLAELTRVDSAALTDAMALATLLQNVFSIVPALWHH